MILELSNTPCSIQTEAFLLLHKTTNDMQILMDMRKCYTCGTSLIDDWIYATVLWIRYWLSKHSWILLIYNRKVWHTALNAQMHGNSQQPGFKFMDIKRQQRYLHVWPEETSRCKDKERNRQRMRRHERGGERGREHEWTSCSVWYHQILDLSGFKHQHIKFRGVSRSYCEIQSCFQHVLQLCPLSKSHVPSPLSVC